jgi:hypothetical protein
MQPVFSHLKENTSAPPDTTMAVARTRCGLAMELEILPGDDRSALAARITRDGRLHRSSSLRAGVADMAGSPIASLKAER